VAGDEICISQAGDRAKFPGSLNVTDGRPFGMNVWYGRIYQDGAFEPSRASSDTVLDFLKKFAADPVETAARYGRRTGNCCFCNRPLSDERSTTVGYGPICAETWSLPWGVAIGFIKDTETPEGMVTT
jgi:hypothetical protein